ncbi:XRN 5'-3' exonuclease N-terminus family protein [Trichomonas vaginalis G3]|uniref:5'-3' exoribonuclease n=1 Tax=Trichomonas vaginalis (strain ATCC PRA-98 / G3) TaxID=412133 RepID=A2EMZ4_TRIV3|nr:5'->3' exoribonuclease family [Trichomonas vaginalis G3]EAY05979.1 XRN 5'-3' exonuclease N-terminus family protein [Trichomonas vaginalis G3]KAI5512017.1 5'->3' exoribonuclease family [Trichomonas vaginalis G3]|eukprot:XP_001318202.1 XRN 5'-3' exonuclease N-terminus family protein [Trichomonas vaginalis G3]
MGVPAFFRTLSRKYPLIISNCIEPHETNGHYLPNASLPNPNTIGDREFDCLYLDMNGLIHPCFHPEGLPPPKSEAEVLQNIENYIERLFMIVRPRQILFMAIDGPAPRAKMNQQRKRRFFAAKQAAHDRWIKYWKAQKSGETELAAELYNPDYLKNHDSNVITPGTLFFERLSKHLHGFIQRKQETDPAWGKICVILSDASVPGEGEHKIMDFVRAQRLEPQYDSNRHHVIYGLDADIIFLGLASHEPYWTILRERINEAKDLPRQNSQQKKATEEDEKMALHHQIFDAPEEKEKVDLIGPKHFDFVSLWILRQYLERDLKPRNLPPNLPWDLERAIDDFIFICYGCGNDFIPTLPGFSIAEGTVSDIICLYKNNLPRYNAYLTYNGQVDFPRFKDFMKLICDERRTGEYVFERNSLLHILCPEQRSEEIEKQVNKISQAPDPDIDQEPPTEAEEKKEERKTKNIVPHVYEGIKVTEETDLAQLKRVYYKQKFHAETKEEIAKIVTEFTRGMIWTLNYYLHGTHNWDWSYPYHSAPCSSDWDLVDVNPATYQFDRGCPFLPLWQLMAVLPPQSAHALPEKMQFLMTNEKSPIKDFYPTTFSIDLEGAKQAYKGHVLVPFIGEANTDWDKRISDVMKGTDLRLTYEEEQRNQFSPTYIFLDDEKAPGGKPPITRESPIIPMNYPVVGRLTWTRDVDDHDGTSHAYIFDLKTPDYRRDFSWMRRDVIPPPYAIEGKMGRADGTDHESFFDRGAIDFESIRAESEMPLQMPGVPQGQDYLYRERMIEKIESERRMFGGNR